MQISLLLFYQILKLFLMILMGYLIVKTGVLPVSASTVLSMLTLFLIVPCSILDAYQIDRTPERAAGLLTAFATALVIHFLLLFFGGVLRKLFRLDPVEQATAMYSNSGNMIIPIITAMLGRQWVIYCSAFMAVQIFFFWTHLKMLLCGERKPDWKKVVTNINLIVTVCGIVMFALDLKLPPLLGETVTAVGSMIGPVSMIITGMLIAAADLKKILRIPRVYLVTVMRLVVIPLCMFPVIAAANLLSALPDRNMVLMIVYLATASPAASTIVQMAQISARTGSMRAR